MANVLYPYALDENGKLVHINDVCKDTRYDHEYRCPYCGEKMVPRLGEHNAKCFAHWAGGSNCSKESYIHQAAKLIIKERFESGHFPIRMTIKEECSVKCGMMNCWNKSSKEFDLAKYYDKPVEIEQSIILDEARFVPDVTFSSTNPKHKPICIEIFFKHPCSEQKLQCCANIIEIPVKDFKDLDDLKTKVLDESYNLPVDGYSASFINFDRKVLSVAPETFANEHPYCTMTDEEKHAFELQASTLWKMYWHDNNKAFVEKILEKDRYVRSSKSAYELTVNMFGHFRDVMYFLIGKMTSLYPEFRRCRNCKHHVCNEYGTEWCELRLNGSSSKGTYNDQKAPHCHQFGARQGSGYDTKVELWKRGDKDDQVTII